MLNREHWYAAARMTMASVCILLCCACLVCLHQTSAGYGGVVLPLASQGSLWFSALACAGVAALCVKSSGEALPWLVLASGIAVVLCMAALVGNMALRQLPG